MTIHHFAADQDDVFVPALLALLLATAAIVLPVVLAPALRRSRRSRALVAAAAVVAVLSLVLAGWQTGVGLRALQDDRARVGAQLRDRYGLELDRADVGVLVDGGRVRIDGETIRLRPIGPDRVEVVAGRRVLPPQA